MGSHRRGVVAEMICHHTYLRWVDQVATCAVCSEKFHDIAFTPYLVGTFPRENAKPRMQTVNTTMTHYEPYRIKMIGENLEYL
jgi:hypothetical protein